MNRLILVVAAFLITGVQLSAQKFSVSTNLLEDACLGTMNIEFSCFLSQKWSITAGAKYNPFTFRPESDRQFQFRQKSFSAGARMWPWHTGSGWWFAGKLRYQEYNWGGLFSRYVQEGDRFGAGLYAGHTYMLSAHLNMEFALGCWAGLDVYDRYSCSYCGLTTGSGKRPFLLPDDVMVALVYVF